MRISLLITLLFFWCGLSAQVVSDKLEAYFSFDDCKAIDDSGNGSSGALNGNVSCACGLRDSCMRFADTSDAIFLVGPFADIFSTSDFTVSFYMRPPDGQLTGNSQIIMAKQENCNTSRAFWVRYRPKTRIISSGISENDSLVTIVQAKLDDAPCWQYITLTRSNTAYTLYVNGTQRDQKTAVARIDLESSAIFKIGEQVCLLDEVYKGDIDELRFHSKALTLEEIARYNLKADQILNRDTLIYLGNSFQLNTMNNCAIGFGWSPATGISDPTLSNPVVTPTAPTVYTVSIVHDNNCIAFDSIFVDVIDPDTLDCNKIFIPNAFTPGASSGLNDAFGVSNKFAIDEFISFEIFDRWGGRVFSATDVSEDWDGRFQGQPVNPGVFLYRLRFKCKGVEKVKAGNLTLLR